MSQVSHSTMHAWALASAAMAQLGFNEPRFEPLPGPGVIEHALFESPLLVAGAIALAGLALGWWLIGHDKRRLGLAVGGGLGAVAIGLVVLARVVVTDREVVIAQTRSLIASIADADWRALDELMLDGGFVIPQRGWGEIPKDRVVDMVRWAHEHEGRYTYAGLAPFRIESVRVRQVRAQVVSDSIARTQINVVVTLDRGRAPVPSWWAVDWDRGDDGRWRARSMTNLWFPVYGSN